MEGQEFDPIKLLTEGAFAASILHSQDQQIKLNGETFAPYLQAAVVGRAEAVQAIVADGLGRIPLEMIVETINLYANLAALDALRAAGYIQDEPPLDIGQELSE